MPWLQDTFSNSAWIAWGVTWRDVRILDSRNQLFAVMNLTANNLALVANRNALKHLLLQAATFLDTDGDKLDDNWELLHFGDLSSTPLGDWDSDGQDNYSEYTFGSVPTDAGSKFRFQATMTGSTTNRMQMMTFPRRTGSAVNYAVDASFLLAPWISSTSNLVMVDPLRNLFDGRGIGQSKYAIPAPLPGSAHRFIRVRATPR